MLWQEWMNSVCVFASIHRRNPDWSKLNWNKSIEGDVENDYRAGIE